MFENDSKPSSHEFNQFGWIYCWIGNDYDYDLFLVLTTDFIWQPHVALKCLEPTIHATGGHGGWFPGNVLDACDDTDQRMHWFA